MKKMIKNDLWEAEWGDRKNISSYAQLCLPTLSVHSES
jgi:hypothetical protein